jgi:hypothetical protein
MQIFENFFKNNGRSSRIAETITAARLGLSRKVYVKLYHPKCCLSATTMRSGGYDALAKLKVRVSV